MSSWHVNQLKFGLGIGGLMSFYGIVALLTFTVGPRLGLQLNQQIVVVALVLLTMPFALVIGYFATRKKKEKVKPEAGEASQTDDADAQKPAKNVAPTGNYAEMNAGADTAIQFLKTSNLGGQGKDALYALPFFLFAGTPRSGKSSLVQASGLNFQTLPDQRQSEQNFVRPTRHIDWRVTSDAVLLDTAGRYQTEGADADEWSALLETLKKHRGLRPLDGLVLVANAEKILAADETEIEQQAKLLRSRLDEALQRTKLRFPVYLVFTNADAIEGFRDSFSVSQKEGKNLILGATFPLEKTANAPALFDAEFESLQQSLMQRRLLRLSAPFPPVRQLRIFNFPAHFGASRRKIGHFVGTLFRPNPFSEAPMFRGFYFTAAISQKSAANGAGQTVNTSYFSEKFFRDVLLRDRNLVATFQAQKVRPPLLGWFLLACGAILIAFLLAMSAISLYFNRQMLAEANERGRAVLEVVKADKGRDPLTKTETEARAEIETTDNLRQTLAAFDDYERNGAPVYKRFGLYSGYQVYHERLLPIYFDAVEQRYKKPVVKRLEDDLRAFGANKTALNSANLTDEQEKELGKYYDLLKAYLMLSGDYQKYAEPTELTNQLTEYWKKSSPAGQEEISQEQLKFYAAQIDREEFPRIQLDKNLVDAARARLQAYPPVFRYYKRVTTEISKKIDAVSVESTLAGRSAGVIDGAYKVPGSFTVEGYRQEMKAAIDRAQSELSKDDWVMGEGTNNATASNADLSKLQERYFNEYTDHWRKFVRGVTVKKYDKKDDAVGAMKSFSSTESPMEILIAEVARNTNLSGKPKPKDWYGWLMSFFEKQDKAQTGGNTEVEREFKPLFAFVGDDAKPEAAPATQYRAAFRPLAENLDNISDDKIKQITKDLAADKDTIGLKKAETAVGNRVEGFTTTAAQDVADLLKKPLQNLRAFFGAGASEQLDKTWREQIFPKAQEIEKGYPFNDAGEADLPKLTAFLNPVSGTLSKFYDERLSKYFEESNGQFKPKESSELKFSPDFVAYINNAFKLREAMFGKGAAANFEYEFKLQPVKDAILEASIDGNKITSEGSSSAKFAFPAKSGGETGAVLQFTSTAEAVSTSGINSNNANSANSSANSGAANVSTSANTNAKQNFAQANNSNTGAAAETSKRFPGQWGLFRMFEAGGAPAKNPNGEYLLTFKIGAKTVTATIRPTGGDLFDKTLFRNVRAPQAMLKQ